MCNAHNRICSGVDKALTTYRPAKRTGCLTGYTQHLLNAATAHGDVVGPDLTRIIDQVARNNWPLMQKKLGHDAAQR